jgi:hypothetical protein
VWRINPQAVTELTVGAFPFVVFKCCDESVAMDGGLLKTTLKIGLLHLQLQ